MYLAERTSSVNWLHKKGEIFPLSLRPIDDINFCSWLGSARNRGHKVCFEREADVANGILRELMGCRSLANNTMYESTVNRSTIIWLKWIGNMQIFQIEVITTSTEFYNVCCCLGAVP